MDTYGITRMYSVYNLAAACAAWAFAPRGSPHAAWDVVRANAVLVACAVFAFTLFVGAEDRRRLYEGILLGLMKTPPDRSPAGLSQVPLRTWVAIDVMLHYAPVALVGFPSTWWSYLAACAVFVAWFAAVHKDVERIYRGVDTDDVFRRVLPSVIVAAAAGSVVLALVGP